MHLKIFFFRNATRLYECVCCTIATTVILIRYLVDLSWSAFLCRFLQQHLLQWWSESRRDIWLWLHQHTASCLDKSRLLMKPLNKSNGYMQFINIIEQPDDCNIHVGEGAPSRDSAQDETIQFSCWLVARYLLISIQWINDYVVYVCVGFCFYADVKPHAGRHLRFYAITLTSLWF